MRWSDGKPFTAADVVFSYEHAADSNVNSTYTENMKSVTALNPTTVRMVLSRYDARFLTGYVPIVPEHIWAPHADTPAHLTKFDPCCPMVGSGAFTVTSLDPNGTIVLKPNPYFYGHPGHIKRILLIKYQDDDAALRDLELGQVDAINTGKTTWAVQLRKQVHAKMWASPAPGFDEIAMNSCPLQGSPTCTGPGQERERQGRPGSGHPPGAQLGDRPRGARADRLQRPLHAGHGDHLVVLQEPRLLHLVRR